MIGDKLIIEKHHTERAAEICSLLAERIQAQPRFALTVAGESGAGKSEIDVRDMAVLIAEGTYTTLLQFADFRIFIDRDYRQTLEARKRRARDKFEPFVVDLLEREHGIISQHRALADVIVSADFESIWKTRRQ